MCAFVFSAHEGASPLSVANVFFEWPEHVDIDLEEAGDYDASFQGVGSDRVDPVWRRWDRHDFSASVNTLVGRGLLREDRATRGGGETHDLRDSFFRTYNGEVPDTGGTHRQPVVHTIFFLKFLLISVTELYQRFFFFTTLLYSRGDLTAATATHVRVETAFRNLRGATCDLAEIYLQARRYGCPCTNGPLSIAARDCPDCQNVHEACPVCQEPGYYSPIRHVVVCEGGVALSYEAARRRFGASNRRSP